MDIKRKRKCYKVMTLIGTNLLLLTTGLSMYWGNIAPYVLSYIAMNSSSHSNLESPWTIFLNLSFVSLGMLIYSFTAKVIGGRWTAVLGILATNTSILAAFFAVKSSFFSLNITLGIVMGFGVGLIQGYAMDVVVQWSKGDLGVLASVSQLLLFFGPFIINPMMTAYINPDNLVANIKTGQFTYYAQVEILDRVSYSFLVLGCLSVPCHIIGILMIKSSKIFDEPSEDNNTQKNRSLNENSIPDAREGYGTNSSPESHMSLEENDASSASDKKQKGGSDEREITNSNEINTHYTRNNSDYTPKEVLRSVAFYAMWISLFLAGIPYIVLPNYYKIFGQLWIHDDHFLTNLGSATAVVNVLMRVFWGFAIDRIGVKKVLIAGMATLTISTSWYFFTPRVDRWLYFFVTTVYAATSGSIYGAHPNVVHLLFGKKHFPINFGLIRAPTIILNWAAPVFIEFILRSFGWFYVFASAGTSCFLSLVLVLRFLPYDGGKKIKYS